MINRFKLISLIDALSLVSDCVVWRIVFHPRQCDRNESTLKYAFALIRVKGAVQFCRQEIHDHPPRLSTNANAFFTERIRCDSINWRNESEKSSRLKRKPCGRLEKVQIEAIKHCDDNQLIRRRENPHEKLLVPDLKTVRVSTYLAIIIIFN